MTLPTPEDHVAITQLLARYCLALDHDDLAVGRDREVALERGLQQRQPGGIGRSGERLDRLHLGRHLGAAELVHDGGIEREGLDPPEEERGQQQRGCQQTQYRQGRGHGMLDCCSRS